MAAVAAIQDQMQGSAPRSSQETERRHLLAQSATPSAATSVLDFETASGQATPRAASPAPSQRTQVAAIPRPYRGFPSEAAYLEALKQWAESKKYLEPPTGLQGFYGNVTMEELADRPASGLGKGFGVRRKVKGWREKRREGRS